MKTSTLIGSIFITIILFGCKESEDLNQDANYPTTINKLEANALDQLRTNYLLKNEYVTSSLNQFGFCDLEEENRTTITPPLLNVLTNTEAEDKAKEFIEKNKSFLGSPIITTISFKRVDLSSGNFWGNATYWALNTNNQRIDTIEVLETNIFMTIKNREVVACTGNWYPSIYIPHEFNINQTKAKTILRGRTVSHTSFGGDIYKVKITEANLAASKTNGLKIYPIESEDKIQLYVTWEIDIPEVSYIIYVDVMTGEIIAEQPTIIS